MRKQFILGMVLSSITFAVNDDIAACLKAWGKHPFKGTEDNYRTIGAKVKVMGMGDNVIDKEVTKKPELVLVKHSVGVMSKQVFELLNPNGWYCIKGAVTVMGKSQIKAHCKAHIATSDDGVAVMGSNDHQGVAVMGSIDLEKVGCDDNSEKKTEKKEGQD